MCQPVRTKSHSDRCCSDRANCCFPFLFCTWNTRAAADGADRAGFELRFHCFTSPVTEKPLRESAASLSGETLPGKNSLKTFSHSRWFVYEEMGNSVNSPDFVEPMGKLYYIQISSNYSFIPIFFPEWARPQGALLTLRLELGVGVLASHQ